MNKEEELENYLSISPDKFGIYLFDKKNLKNLYKEELILNEYNNSFDLNTLNFKLNLISNQIRKN